MVLSGFFLGKFLLVPLPSVTESSAIPLWVWLTLQGEPLRMEAVSVYLCPPGFMLPTQWEEGRGPASWGRASGPYFSLALLCLYFWTYLVKTEWVAVPGMNGEGRVEILALPSAASNMIPNPQPLFQPSSRPQKEPCGIPGDALEATSPPRSFLEALIAADVCVGQPSVLRKEHFLTLSRLFSFAD